MSDEKERHRFDELNKGYYSYYHETNTSDQHYQHQQQQQQDKSEYIRMDKPHQCSYTKKTDYKGTPKETLNLGQPIPRQACSTVTVTGTGTGTTNDSSMTITPLPVEMRGITLEQLLAVVANMERRCQEEQWVSTRSTTTTTTTTTTTATTSTDPDITTSTTDTDTDTTDTIFLTPEQVTWYDMNKYIIIPYTSSTESSLVETLPSTSGTQPPRFFITHAWSETIYHTIDCIQQMLQDMNRNYDKGDEKKGGGMTKHTPIWICAFAMNQHQVQDDMNMGMGMDVNMSSNTSMSMTGDTTGASGLGFAKAMQVAKYRTCVVLDKDGTIFTRMWCLFELYISLLQVQQKTDDTDVDVDVDVDVDTDWNGLWAIYTPYEHTYHGVDKTHGEKRKAVGIFNLPGGATSDEWASDTANRERYFPMRRVLKAMALDHDCDYGDDYGYGYDSADAGSTGSVNDNHNHNSINDNAVMVQTAKASREKDEMNILHYISGVGRGSSPKSSSKSSSSPTKYLGFKQPQPRPRPPKEHGNYDILNDAIRGAFASTIAVLQYTSRGVTNPATNTNTNTATNKNTATHLDPQQQRWQNVLTIMSKSTCIKSMEFDFDSSVGISWNHLTANPQKAAEMISHLPPSLENLTIYSAPFGIGFLDAVIDWIRNDATHLKSLAIWYTCSCMNGNNNGNVTVNGNGNGNGNGKVTVNANGGRDVGGRLAKALTVHKTTMERLNLYQTDLIGSRNVHEWRNAISNMTCLKEFKCVGMGDGIKYNHVDESTLDGNSTVKYPYDKRQRIFWKDGTFPDATMAKEDEMKLKGGTKAKVLMEEEWA